MHNSFSQKNIGCKDQMFFLLPFERNLCRNVFYETKMQKLRFEILKIKIL